MELMHTICKEEPTNDTIGTECLFIIELMSYIYSNIK